jgi:hypothetical protein
MMMNRSSVVAAPLYHKLAFKRCSATPQFSSPSVHKSWCAGRESLFSTKKLKEVVCPEEARNTAVGRREWRRWVSCPVIDRVQLPPARLSNVPRENGVGKERHTPRNALLPVGLSSFKYRTTRFSLRRCFPCNEYSQQFCYSSRQIFYLPGTTHRQKSRCNREEGKVVLVPKDHMTKACSRCYQPFPDRGPNSHLLIDSRAARE